MKIELNIDAHAEEKIMISAKQVTPVLSDFLKDTEKRFNNPRLVGKHEDHIYPIALEAVARFIVENNQVLAVTNTKVLKMEQRLYQLEEIISSNFTRISKSEIVNMDYLDHLKLEPNGLAQIVLKNGDVTYASRRYLKTIKERLLL